MKMFGVGLRRMRLFGITILALMYTLRLAVDLVLDVTMRVRDDHQKRKAMDLPQHDENRYLQIDGFMGSPATTLIQYGGCECELMSLDCLDAIRCLPMDSLEKIHEGVVTRQEIQKRSEYWTSSLITKGRGESIGKSSQEVSILIWKEWLSRNELPKGLLNDHEPYVNGTMYPFCKQSNLEGRACFIAQFSLTETLGELEKSAVKKYRKVTKQVAEDSKQQLTKIQGDPYNVSSWQYLQAFSHVSRIAFNLRSHVINDVYKRHVKTIDHSRKVRKLEVLRVALHIRRGNACQAATGYADDHSPLDSPAQVKGQRLCYHTSVYTDSIARIVEMVPNRHVVVYLASDYSLSLMEELRTEYEHVYKMASWKYLDYSPSIFGIPGKNASTTQNKPLMGEATVTEAWHVSHGQVFVGHLGSHFGKLAWFQATARHNAFVPFFSVDGHSICCEIDESCGAMKQFVVSMENCHAIVWPESKFMQNVNQEEYWKKGLLIRKDAAVEEMTFREERKREFALIHPSMVTDDVSVPDVQNTQHDLERSKLKSKEQEVNNDADYGLPVREPKKNAQPMALESQLLNGTNKETRMKFVGSPFTAKIHVIDPVENCECDLRQLDCLDSIRCVISSPSQDIFSGVITRDVIRRKSTLWDHRIENMHSDTSLGAAAQYTTILMWRQWLSKNQLPLGLANESIAFVNETFYPECQSKSLYGRACFFQGTKEKETWGSLEKEVIKEIKTSETQSTVEGRLEAIQRNPFETEPLDYLLTFSQLSLMGSGLRPHMHTIYSQRLKKIDHGGNKAKNTTFRVAMHVRRGDACHHKVDGFDEDEKSTGRRCYEIQEYGDSLQRIIQKLENFHIIVYLATDSPVSIIKEFKTKCDPEVFEAVSWRYLNHTLPIFDYTGDERKNEMYIESAANGKKALLGEAAVLDTWHLSHGQAFIGHLGSRLGKVSWWHAMARHNNFVPYFTVDGHGPCCEIDEKCVETRQHVLSMENCLALEQPNSALEVVRLGSKDWEKGSSFRETAASAEIEYRKGLELGMGGLPPPPPPHEFAGSPASTLIELGDDCQCPLLSIDCLDAIRCIPKNPMRQIYSGVVTRRTIQGMAKIWDESLAYILVGSPMGMAQQFVSSLVWKEWLSKNELPKGLRGETDPFVNETRYVYCRKNNLVGRSCFINDFVADEVYGDVEEKAVEKYSKVYVEEKQLATKKIRAIQDNPFNATALEFLLTFAHLSKITMNLRSHVHDIYRDHLTTIDHKSKNFSGVEMRVAMHLRRGDACGHVTSGYQVNASPLDSPAQMGQERVCYDTNVYMNSLQRVVDMLPTHHIVVYVATDHCESLMDEIKEKFSDIFGKVSWKYMEYSREIFQYLKFLGDDESGAFIENPRNKNRPILGETAVADIWHLSHGQIFIGHLGSRFGKLGWLQATARYNSFIPFFTVDGHSVCCDIDEPCGEMAEYVVSMESCVGTFWPETNYRDEMDLDIYFSKGAYFRKAAAKDEVEFRRKKGVKVRKVK